MTEMEKSKIKKALVPNLRFPGFEGEWENRRLSDIAEYRKERTAASQLIVETYISTENMSPDYQGVFPALNIPSGGNVSAFYPGDVLLSNIRPYLKKVWQANVIGGCSTDVMVIKAKKCVIDKFLYYIIANDSFINYAMAGAKGVKMPRGDKEQLMKYELAIPSIDEQYKIASLLTLIDQRIAIQNKVIEKYESLIKAINQRHFMSIRNNVSLSPVKLSRILRERKEYCENDGTYPHASLSKDGVDRKTERYDRDFLVRDDEKKYKVTRLNDICYNPANLKFGVISRNKIGTFIFSPIYVTFEIEPNYNSEYIEYYLTNPDFVKYMLKYEQGTVYERMAVSPEDFLSESIRVPSLSEQHRHSAIISYLNRHLDDERMTLMNWYRFKRGCLKQLFT